jgi:hypothetical protein
VGANERQWAHSRGLIQKRIAESTCFRHAVWAMPVNLNSAATIAIIRKITAQGNIGSPPQKQIERSHNDVRFFCASRCDKQGGRIISIIHREAYANGPYNVFDQKQSETRLICEDANPDLER